MWPSWKPRSRRMLVGQSGEIEPRQAPCVRPMPARRQREPARMAPAAAGGVKLVGHGVLLLEFRSLAYGLGVQFGACERRFPTKPQWASISTAYGFHPAPARRDPLLRGRGPASKLHPRRRGARHDAGGSQLSDQASGGPRRRAAFHARRARRDADARRAGGSRRPITEAFTQMRAAFERSERNGGERFFASPRASTFATNWLVPRLGAFQLKHPGIAVSLDVIQRACRFRARGRRCRAFAAASGQWPGLAAHPLMRRRLYADAVAAAGRALWPAQRAGRPFAASADRPDRRLVGRTGSRKPACQLPISPAADGHTRAEPAARRTRRACRSGRRDPDAGVLRRRARVRPPGAAVSDRAAIERQRITGWSMRKRGGARRRSRAFSDWILAEAAAAK